MSQAIVFIMIRKKDILWCGSSFLSAVGAGVCAGETVGAIVPACEGVGADVCPGVGVFEVGEGVCGTVGEGVGMALAFGTGVTVGGAVVVLVLFVGVGAGVTVGVVEVGLSARSLAIVDGFDCQRVFVPASFSTTSWSCCCVVYG